MAAAFKIGQRVVANGNPSVTGVVKFVGPTQFAAGEWVGVALDKPVGKNNGNVKGVQYFECPANHGVFVKPEALLPAPDVGQSSRGAGDGASVMPRAKSIVGRSAPAKKYHHNRRQQAGGEEPRPSVSRSKGSSVTDASLGDAGAGAEAAQLVEVPAQAELLDIPGEATAAPPSPRVGQPGVTDAAPPAPQGPAAAPAVLAATLAVPAAPRSAQPAAEGGLAGFAVELDSLREEVARLAASLAAMPTALRAEVPDDKLLEGIKGLLAEGHIEEVVRAAVKEATADLAASIEELRRQMTLEHRRDISDLSTACTTSAASSGSGADAASLLDPGEPPPDEKHLGHEFRGVSVHHFTTDLVQSMELVGLTHDVKVYEIEDDVIRRKGMSVVCPRDGRKGAAYVDCIYGPDNAGLATFMLSYTWGYKVGDIGDTLMQFCRSSDLDPKRTYAWICCLCINQHRVKEKQAAGEVVAFEDFQSAFGQRVAGIGKVVAMMAPWRDPTYMKRVWCDFEMYTATTLWPKEAIENKVFIAMPPAEAEDFRRALLKGGVGEVWKALGNVNVEKAEASVPEDKERILTLIKEGPGFHGLNCAVAERLQAWIVQVSEGYLQEQLSSNTVPDAGLAHLGEEVGVLLKQVGHLDRSFAAFEAAHRLRVQTGTLEKPEGANLLRNMGVLRAERGKPDEALKAFEEALAIRKATNTISTNDGARLYSNIGAVKVAQGDLDSAFRAYQEALRIREVEDLLETTEGALLQMNIGYLKRCRGDLAGALEAYEAARKIREETGTLTTPDGARLLSSIGDVRGAQGNCVGEREAYEEARHCLEVTGTLTTMDGAMVLTNLAAARVKCGDPEGGLATYERARIIREFTGTLGTPEGKKLQGQIGALKVSMRRLKKKAADEGGLTAC